MKISNEDFIPMSEELRSTLEKAFYDIVTWEGYEFFNCWLCDKNTFLTDRGTEVTMDSVKDIRRSKFGSFRVE